MTKMHDDSIDAFTYGLKRLNIPYYHAGCNRNKNYYSPYFENRFEIEYDGKFTQLKNEYTPYECDPFKNAQCPKTECFIRGGYCHATFNENYKKEGDKNMYQTTLGKVNYVANRDAKWHCLVEKIGKRVLESLNPGMTVRFEPELDSNSYLGSRCTLWITSRYGCDRDISWPYGNGCQSEFTRTGNIIVEVPFDFYLKFRNAVLYESAFDVSNYAERDRYETMIAALKWQLNSLYGIKSAPDAIEDVIFNKPAVIVKWKDGTKTVVKAQGKDKYDPEKGLAMAIAKKSLGNKHEYYNTFKHWLKKSK